MAGVRASYWSRKDFPIAESPASLSRLGLNFALLLIPQCHSRFRRRIGRDRRGAVCILAGPHEGV